MEVSEAHFLRAAREIGKSGENDTLPYDPDARFIKESAARIAALCKSLYDRIAAFETDDGAKGFVNSLELFSERLLSPAGAHGFRIVTKIHPFWNVYLNGLGIAIGGQRAQQQLRRNAIQYWALGMEQESGSSFAELFIEWARSA